jgi:CheY-like chemotaxis protein
MPYKAIVIDDDKTTANYLADELRMLGHSVSVAFGPREALSQMLYDIPDVVFLDINMPGIDGIEVTRFLRRDPRTASIPVIAISASEEQVQQDAAHFAGVNYYIVKPAMVEDLEKALQHVMPPTPTSDASVT